MNIDKNNYEEYFLDYLEGRLSTEETAALLLFADENPDLKELLEGEELIYVDPDKTISFFPKSALKKKIDIEAETNSEINASFHNAVATSDARINADNYEDFMIRYYENDLEDAEKADLSVFLKDSPKYIKEFETFGNTLLKPDTGVIYPYKNGLNRKQFLPSQTKKIFTIVSVAASLLLFSTLFLKYIDQPNPKEQNKQLAGSNNSRVETVRPINSKINIASVNPTDISHTNKSALTNKTSAAKVISSKKSTVIRMGFEPMILNHKAPSTERTVLEVPAILDIKQSALLASAQIKAPKSIDRRTDFDGITSAAYYDPDPDALPLNTKGKTIGGRLGYTLASGLSQTAGTIARKPELGRLLQGKFSLADLAGLGLAGFDIITDSKLTIARRYDTDGNQKGYSIVNGNKKP